GVLVPERIPLHSASFGELLQEAAHGTDRRQPKARAGRPLAHVDRPRVRGQALEEVLVRSVVAHGEAEGRARPHALEMSGDLALVPPGPAPPPGPSRGTPRAAPPPPAAPPARPPARWRATPRTRDPPCGGARPGRTPCAPRSCRACDRRSAPARAGRAPSIRKARAAAAPPTFPGTENAGSRRAPPPARDRRRRRTSPPAPRAG